MPGNTLESLDLSLQIPYHFRCPISLELMRDPVTVSTGQTYDRSSIESWIATGNTTCPVTRAQLTDFTVIPNHTLRRLIQDWCVANRSSGVERIPTPKQPAEPTLVRNLLAQAASISGPDHSRVSALRKLKSLARDSEKNRHLISSHSAKQILIDVLFSNSSTSAELTHESLALLVLFQLTEAECVSVSSDPDRICLLKNLLFHPSIDVKVNAASLIEIVVVGTRSSELRQQVSSSDEIFEGVVEILRNPNVSSPRALKIGIKALFSLCLAKQTRHKAVEAGAAAALVDRLAEFDKGDAERALATVELLCRVPAGCSALEDHALTVPLLVKSILKISDRATEYAAGALEAMCSVSEKSLREAVAAGVMTQLLLLVQSDCTDRAKRKAQALLKLLRDSWPEESAAGTSDHYFVCSEVVPF